MIRIPSLPGFSHPQSIIGAPRDGSNHPRLRENDHIPCDKFTAWVCSMATDPNEFLVSKPNNMMIYGLYIMGN